MAFAFRFFRRLLAFAAYGAAIGALVFIIWPLLPIPEGGGGGSSNESAVAAETKTVAKRPDSLPYRIPSWAWQLHKWMLTSPDERGPRPKAAPGHVPQWFWDFRKWRLALAPQS